MALLRWLLVWLAVCEGTSSSSSEHEWPSEDEDRDWGDEQRRPLGPRPDPAAPRQPSGVPHVPVAPNPGLHDHAQEQPEPLNQGRLIWSPSLDDDQLGDDREAELRDQGEVHQPPPPEPSEEVRHRGRGDVLRDQGEVADSPPPQPLLTAALHDRGEVHHQDPPAPPPVAPLLPDPAAEGHLVNALATYGVPQHDLQRCRGNWGTCHTGVLLCQQNDQSWGEF